MLSEARDQSEKFEVLNGKELNKIKFFGKISNNLSSGIIGLANVGKSSFFQNITRSKLGNPGNYPFATIKPEESRVLVPSKRLNVLSEIYKSKKKIGAFLNVIDIAGLTKGASKGEGLGNQFLNDIKNVDGIFQMVRGFNKKEIVHIEGDVNPVRDLEIVFDELILKDMEYLENHLVKMEKKKKGEGKNSGVVKEIEVVKKALESCLYKNIRIMNFDWSNDEIEVLNQFNLLTSKPVVYLLNVSKEDYLSNRNEYYEDVKKWISANSANDELIMFSSEYESELNERAEAEGELQKEMEEYEEPSDKDEKYDGSVLPKIIKTMRRRLRLISFFTCGPVEAREWTIRKGTTAPEAAGVIHTDLQNNFICAEVLAYGDVACELPNATKFDSSKLAKTGRVARVGSSYTVRDGDVVLIKAGNMRAR
ncbi:GTP-binding protein YchF [Ascoidea rubescens DSM 1968]|uniref:GTP-binding protein YchF n=1 Tax=Ascoidea rubescens DSM 1968 TaxID=1344418 RepID=A0A1D2VFZ6_9ASCO|nr:GTP-binding protein YchF [Ascoidea rubescens DSM 1968]ODV60604.1 GTP-binding protein YchF [Ascoidea rubescens DSM 1968]